ncbi:hypothetical protein [Oceanicoccus sp. KOV_DT_Chl]|uniref:hypothetical protein n=1 Tax=Oceanicoccus sp. KOV_DT_Chl TaxID=1904639 RepID=UPI000C7E2E4F|nr:hypothetical protein [Oceanicoccus sp. KOV_DT_Chl]
MTAAFNTAELPANTPVLIGAGQMVEREASQHSHMQLAAQAAVIALGHATTNSAIDNDALAANIDTIAVTRLFSDMGQLWPVNGGVAITLRNRLLTSLKPTPSIGFTLALAVINRNHS